LDFPVGAVVKNPPAGNEGLIPGQGTKILYSKRQPSLCATTTEPVMGDTVCCKELRGADSQDSLLVGVLTWWPEGVLKGPSLTH